MIKKALVCAIFLALGGCNTQQTNDSAQQNLPNAEQEKTQLTYPNTRKGDVVDNYFETKVSDPYRWLEDDMSEETAAWVKSQNEVTFNYLAQIPYRDKLKQSLEALMNYEKVSAPFTEGKYTYFYKNDGLQNQYVLYRQTGESEPEVFLDPNTFSSDGTTSLAGISFSKDGSLAAYQISETNFPL